MMFLMKSLKVVFVLIMTLMCLPVYSAFDIEKGMKVGDSKLSYINPSHIISADDTPSGEILRNPKVTGKVIDFTLKTSFRLKRIRLKRARGLSNRLYFLIWKKGETIPIINSISIPNKSKYKESEVINRELSPGEYQIAVVGQCYGKPRYGRSRYIGWRQQCNSYFGFDDFQFKGIRLVGKKIKNAVTHYRIQHPSSALTCDVASIDVQACKNKVTDKFCNVADVSTTVKLRIDNRSSQTVNIVHGRATVGNLALLSPGVMRLSVNSEGNTYCNDASVAGACKINFTDLGLKFSSNANTYVAIGNQIAGVSIDSLYLQALENDGSGTCKVLETDDSNFNIGLNCVEPDKCTVRNFNIGNTAIGKNGNKSRVKLTAVKPGIFKIPASVYHDAGKIRLVASHSFKNGVEARGESNSFVVRPDRFLVQATSSTGSDLTATTNNLSIYTQIAAKPFTFEVSAVSADGNTTLNYHPSTKPKIGIKITRKIPNNNGVEGIFDYAAEENKTTALDAGWQTANLTLFNNGVSSFKNAAYNEVGVMQVNVRDTDYYGMTFSVDDNFSDDTKGTEIGRFIPSHFELVSSKVDNYVGARGYFRNGYDYVFPDGLSSYVAGTTVLQPKDGNVYECRAWPNNGYCVQWNEGSNQYEPGVGRNWEMAWILLTSPSIGAVFTYMDQPELRFGYRLEAQNSLGFVTHNYDGAFNADVTFSVEVSGLRNRFFSDRLEEFKGIWVDGVYQPDNIFDDGYFSRLASGPDGPIMNTLFGISITDLDGVLLNDTDMPANAELPAAKTLSAQTSELRYGRWTVADGYGPISNDFATTMQLEYFNGKNFIKNNDDTKTDFDFVKATLTNISLGGALPALSGTGNFTNGITQGLIIAAPNRSGEVKLDYTVDNWFKYNWEGSETGAVQSPSANIVFGFFRSNDRVIYRRRLN